MKRSIELRLKITEIDLHHWMPTDQDAIVFPFQKGKLKGIVSLNLDPEAVKPDYVVYGSGEQDWDVLPGSCNQVIVRIEAECDGEVSDREFLSAAQALTARYLNKMLSYVRIELGQYWISLTRISEWGLYYFLLQAQAKWMDGHSEQVLDSWDIALATPPISDFYDHSLALDKTRWESISHFIQEESEHDLAKMLMANAKQHFEDGNYRMAAVEALTSLDVGLTPFVRKRCKERGISYTKYDKTSRRIFISDYLRVLLPLVLGKQELNTWLRTNSEHGLTGQFILDECLQLNSVRNAIVHQGKIPEEKDIERIKRGIEASELLLSFVKEAGGKHLPME